jgi:hypothetical protein
MDKGEPRSRDFRGAALRIVAAVAVAAAFALGVYALLEASRPVNGLIGFAFLLVLPAAISAFVAYVADPWGERRLSAYVMVPVWLLVAVVAVSIFTLKEGTVCIVMLGPLWLGSGAAGAALTYHLRRRLKRGRTYCLTVLALPLLALQVEPHLPTPAAEATVSRSIVIAAPPERIWPLLRGIPDVRPGEGRWNLSQDVIGVPRPLGARLVGEGVGAQRLASWGEDIRFREQITEWSPGRRIGWRFIFDDIDAWRFTDRHLTPDSSYFRVTTGGYSLTPLDAGHTRVTLDTRYWMKTPLNGYAALWGQVFLGDLEGNLLALVKQRAERPAA